MPRLPFQICPKGLPQSQLKAKGAGAHPGLRPLDRCSIPHTRWALIHQRNLQGGLQHLTEAPNEETDAQRGSVLCPRPHSWSATEQRLGAGFSDSTRAFRSNVLHGARWVLSTPWRADRGVHTLLNHGSRSGKQEFGQKRPQQALPWSLCVGRMSGTLHSTRDSARTRKLRLGKVASQALQSSERHNLNLSTTLQAALVRLLLTPSRKQVLS